MVEAALPAHSVSSRLIKRMCMFVVTCTGLVTTASHANVLDCHREQCQVYYTFIVHCTIPSSECRTVLYLCCDVLRLF